MAQLKYSFKGNLSYERTPCGHNIRSSDIGNACDYFKKRRHLNQIIRSGITVWDYGIFSLLLSFVVVVLFVVVVVVVVDGIVVVVVAVVVVVVVSVCCCCCCCCCCRCCLLLLLLLLLLLAAILTESDMLDWSKDVNDLQRPEYPPFALESCPHDLME